MLKRLSSHCKGDPGDFHGLAKHSQRQTKRRKWLSGLLLYTSHMEKSFKLRFACSAGAVLRRSEASDQPRQASVVKSPRNGSLDGDPPSLAGLIATSSSDLAVLSNSLRHRY